jgi:hypothetical protein
MMSDDQESNHSSPGSDATASPANPTQSKKRQSKPSKARLTSAQKNTNHRDAENKRRDGIRSQFEELCRMVPGAENDVKSEQVCLTKTADYLEEQLTDMRQMMKEMERRGMPIKDEWRAMLGDEDFGGANYQTPAMDDYQRKKVQAEGRKPGAGEQNGNAASNGDLDDGD